MRPDNYIQKLIENLKITASAELDAKVHSAVDGALAEKKRIESAYKPTIWRIIMKSPFTKLAAAAVIVAAVLAGIHFFGGAGVKPCFSWDCIVRPIMDARTAELDIIVGDENNSPVIHDMIMGSKIRRTMEGVEGSVSIIDLASLQILTLETGSKKATYIDLKGLPPMPNYMDQLKGVIKMLQSSPGFVVDELGRQDIDGQSLYGFRAKHPQAEIVIYVDTQTALPVRIEQEGGQMKAICKNIRFDVPMDESLFSMDAPEGYKVEQQELDLLGSTEEDFIEGLRMQAEIVYDGMFPDDVSVEYYVKQVPMLIEKFDRTKLTDEQKKEIGSKLDKGLMFIRFFKGEGKWHYAGKGVKFGDADTAIFWYRPAGSQTYHVIYGDLSIEDVDEQDLPQPVAEQPALK
ncbi:MAG: hypothetical protein JW749_11725 [Sedimentisphaerales bacterium]|nr:hypothetical protein [Sedimentisphaerales bacterium]